MTSFHQTGNTLPRMPCDVLRAAKGLSFVLYSMLCTIQYAYVCQYACVCVCVCVCVCMHACMHAFRTVSKSKDNIFCTF